MDRLVMKKYTEMRPPLDYANKTNISKLLNFIMKKVFSGFSITSLRWKCRREESDSFRVLSDTGSV